MKTKKDRKINKYKNESLFKNKKMIEEFPGERDLRIFIAGNPETAAKRCFDEKVKE